MTDPRYLVLAALLRRQGIDVVFNAELRNRLYRRELRMTAPLLATHPIHKERIVVISTNHTEWKERLRYRGIELMTVTQEELVTYPNRVAEQVCKSLYKVGAGEVQDMLVSGQTPAQITAMLDLSPSFVSECMVEMEQR